MAFISQSKSFSKEANIITCSNLSSVHVGVLTSVECRERPKPLKSPPLLLKMVDLQ